MNFRHDRLATGRRALRLAGAAALGLLLAGCAGLPDNRTVDNIHQPVVEHTNYTFDLVTLPEGGIDPVQAHRLNAWFAALGLKYGDHVALDDPSAGPATHAGVETIAARFGLILEPIAPVTEGAVPAGSVRVVVSRAVASVPGCPDWSTRSDLNPNNATSRNYGCATSSNMAAMVANKEDLIHGQSGVGDTVVATNTKAIDSFRAKQPTGAGAVKQQSTQ